MATRRGKLGRAPTVTGLTAPKNSKPPVAVAWADEFSDDGLEETGSQADAANGRWGEIMERKFDRYIQEDFAWHNDYKAAHRPCMTIATATSAKAQTAHLLQFDYRLNPTQMELREADAGHHSVRNAASGVKSALRVFGDDHEEQQGPGHQLHENLRATSSAVIAHLNKPPVDETVSDDDTTVADPETSDGELEEDSIVYAHDSTWVMTPEQKKEKHVHQRRHGNVRTSCVECSMDLDIFMMQLGKERSELTNTQVRPAMKDPHGFLTPLRRSLIHGEPLPAPPEPEPAEPAETAKGAGRKSQRKKSFKIMSQPKEPKAVPAAAPAAPHASVADERLAPAAEELIDPTVPVAELLDLTTVAEEAEPALAATPPRRRSSGKVEPPPRRRSSGPKSPRDTLLEMVAHAGVEGEPLEKAQLHRALLKQDRQGRRGAVSYAEGLALYQKQGLPFKSAMKAPVASAKMCQLARRMSETHKAGRTAAQQLRNGATQMKEDQLKIEQQSNIFKGKAEGLMNQVNELQHSLKRFSVS